MKNTQCNQIIKYMKDHGSITALEAVRHIGCLRLPSRIYDLRKRGYNITSEMQIVPTRNGETRVAVYSLIEDEGEE